MISTKKHIQQLAALLQSKGISDAIISPGSRNGPIIHTLVGCGHFNCRNIVDERSAGYFAIGLSQSTKKPVVLVCSSGTATLNYAPAVAEAFYLKVPLIVITADRPEYWINQGESQCIPQKNIYNDFVKSKANLPLGESKEELWQAQNQINNCLNSAISSSQGPVHINVPLEEPLHDIVDSELPEIKTIGTILPDNDLNTNDLNHICSKINNSKRILILAGQQDPSKELENSLNVFVEKSGAVVLKEHLSNMHSEAFISNIDALMASILNDTIEDFRPNLLITFGGQMVSKSLKQFLRKYKAQEHWHLSEGKEHYDTYQSLTKVISLNALDFFKQINKKTETQQSDFVQLWTNKEKQVEQIRDEYIDQCEFSDLKVFSQLRSYLPKDSVLHLGNSSPVRYALIVDASSQIHYLSNRGTSGIDGCLSNAVGFASHSNKINTIVLGDLSFFYDSNALWNDYIGKNIRVIVIHNGGGNIFGLIKGPSESPAYQKHFFTENKYKAEGIARAFGIKYFKAENKLELQTGLQELYNGQKDGPMLLEVFTNAEINTKTFRGLFKQVKI